MNFSEAQTYLSGALRFGIKPGLVRMKRLLALLDCPYQTLRCIHIAGTNGKGSTSAYCASILAAAGLKVGLYTSPYLVRLTERIRVIEGLAGLERLAMDETEGEISPDAFARLLTRIRTAVGQMLCEGEEHPTEFELLTAASFMYYLETNCDIVVLETGLGGRLDSTNVIDKPLASIITALGYDHMDRLGGTLAEITAEKAGIIKQDCPVFLYNVFDLSLSEQDQTAADGLLRQRCRSLGATLDVVRQADISLLDYTWSGQLFQERVTGLTARTRLLGVIQPMNASLAIRTCAALGLATDDQIRTGIALARWPARLELLRLDPPVLVDGAHNPQGCQALAATLDRLLPDQPVVFLMGFLADKDYEAMLRIMLEQTRYRPAAVVCTKPVSLRALPEEPLAQKVRAILNRLPDGGGNRYNEAVWTAPTPEEGAQLALKLASDQSMALCAFGSLYMVGYIRQTLMQEEQA
ncbi:MAG: bifunctional folylpolyglutamate synthase/dihydrofolate synthase [Clostridiaceae bacterium]|jgi:dihydrofolate synthase/folylpolyglutamate synthase|nr:bifunctional folylpolyglutamate synthase/dihydrofolate synthase [Clostridiaceae bacterium]